MIFAGCDESTAIAPPVSPEVVEQPHTNVEASQPQVSPAETTGLNETSGKVVAIIDGDSRLFAFAFEDDYMFGVLHSRPHEIWSLRQGARHGVGNDPTYNNDVCFATFPIPRPGVTQKEQISTAAFELNQLRERWLNPPEWVRKSILEFSGSTNGPWSSFIVDTDEHGIGTVRYPRLVPKDDACASQLANRTLTKLYNERPTWLDLAHKKLNEAVFAAYGWDLGISDDELLANLLALNLERAAAEEAES